MVEMISIIYLYLDFDLSLHYAQQTLRRLCMLLRYTLSISLLCSHIDTQATWDDPPHSLPLVDRPLYTISGRCLFEDSMADAWAPTVLAHVWLMIMIVLNWGNWLLPQHRQQWATYDVNCGAQSKWAFSSSSTVADVRSLRTMFDVKTTMFRRTSWSFIT